MRGLLRAALVVAVGLTACRPASVTEGDLAFDVSVQPSPPAIGTATVEVALRDSAAAPVTGATLRVEGTMSHAGMVPVFADAGEVRAGVYSASLELTMAGDWYLVITAQLPDGRTVEHTHELPGVRRDS